MVNLYWRFVEGGGGGFTVVHISQAKELADRLNEQHKGFAVHWFETPNKRLHWTLRLWAWLKNCVGLGSRQ